MPITTDIKLAFEQYDMTPGNPGRRFRRNLLIHGTKSDEAGFSVADTLARSDEGAVDAAGNPAPGAPTIPAAANTANDKRRALRVTRVKNSFSFLVAHISDEPTKTLLADPPFFQNGPTAFDYVMGEVLIPVDQGQLNEMTLTWLTMTIISYVGYNENSVNEMVKVMRVPAQHGAPAARPVLRRSRRFLNSFSGVLSSSDGRRSSRNVPHPIL